MLPDWVLTTCGVLAVFATIILVVRRRRRRRAITTEAAAAYVAVAEADQPQDLPAPKHASVSASVPALEPASVSWTERKLFTPLDSSIRDAVHELPRIDPDQVPHVDIGDFVFGPATSALAAMLPETKPRQEELKRDLLTAGHYEPHALENISAIRMLAVLGPILLFGLALPLVPSEAEVAVLIMLVGISALGWAFPRLYVKSKANIRTNEINRSLPDMLDMLNMCVSQGLTVGQSLRRISRDLKPVYPALSQELRIVCEQGDVGTLQHALENFKQRINISEVHSFTSLLTQTERMGTSVSAALTEYSDTMRTSLQQRADEKANRSAFRLLFPTVLCLMPAVFLILLGPAIIELSDFLTGSGGDAVRAGADAARNFNGPVGQ